MASKREQAWALFDKITTDASAAGYTNPWSPGDAGMPVYLPDYTTLRKLLGVPVLLAANTQSGVTALALDVWMAYEFRRCGFNEDALWPRATAPRVLPIEVTRLVNGLPKTLKAPLLELIRKGKVRGGTASANILGKNYVKQVDVGLSSWDTGPELLISTKRMDSSFGKNAANRIEESYGDAKNLRLRHPQAGHGFFFGLRSTAFSKEPRTAEWLIDLLIKMGQEDDAYDAVGLIVPEWGSATDDTDTDADPAEDDTFEEDTAVPQVSADVIEGQLAQLPPIDLQFDKVPAELSPERFIALLATKVIRNSPISFHREARSRRQQALGGAQPLTRGL